MDDYLDPCFSSSWSDENSSPLSMIGSNHSIEWLAAHDDNNNNNNNNNNPPLVHVHAGSMSGECGLQMDGENCSFGFGNLGLQFDAAVHSKDLSVVGDMTPSLSFNERGHVICNGGESAEFRRSFTDSGTLSAIPQLWHLQQNK
ncbi:hypothetical protein HRI_002673900 [Hibiscus trionum]|uniref:Uncharacterized protein n=1 Tax=Hibiscus trionum TaxID=183268 RepID=A0A9W7I715_HIBTR|nr:hypothetical protein HRI_002673900 [Hibiscus trionum]